MCRECSPMPGSGLREMPVSCGPRWLTTVLLCLLVDVHGADEDGMSSHAGESRIEEYKSILKSRGAACRGCNREEEFARRVAETRTWRGDEAVSPDGKLRITRRQFAAGQHRLGSHAGHELDDGRDDDESPGGHALDAAWEEFRDAVRNGEFLDDGAGGLKRRRPSFWDLSWHVHAKWSLTATLAICLLSKRLLGATQSTRTPYQQPQYSFEDDLDPSLFAPSAPRGGGGAGGKRGENNSKKGGNNKRRK